MFAFMFLWHIFCSRVLSNWFLTVAAFLDPRFQTFKNLSDVQRIKEQLEKSLDHDGKFAETKTIKAVTLKSEKLQATSRKSGKLSPNLYRNETFHFVLPPPLPI